MIGILGGGQLGRMLSLAASRLGMRTHIFCPDPNSPAFEVTPHKTVAAYDDEAALAAFADAVDVITYEFENVPAATAEFLAARKPLRPGANALAISQDRLAEKAFLASKNIPVAPYRAVDRLPISKPPSTPSACPPCSRPRGWAMTARASASSAPRRGHSRLRRALAQAAGARSLRAVRKGNLGRRRPQCSPAKSKASMRPKTSTATTSSSPAPCPPRFPPRSKSMPGMIAKAIVIALDYVGVLGVEFFVVPGDGRPTLLVNEIAPRVHNSGHWTEAVCLTDQFEQHIRAVLGWPLGDPARLADVVMENLIGDEVLAIPAGL